MAEMRYAGSEKAELARMSLHPDPRGESSLSLELRRLLAGVSGASSGRGNLSGLLALLAPLAALPIIAGTALPLTMAPMLIPAMSTVLGRRRRRDLLGNFLGNEHKCGIYWDSLSPLCGHSDRDWFRTRFFARFFVHCRSDCCSRLSCDTSPTTSSRRRFTELASMSISATGFSVAGFSPSDAGATLVAFGSATSAD
ncbi:hypothetical protein IscW_ISCW005853 [Ixodes scapularis]|uniref:Uncharacterized protein n=1 Tax=Ixodes scapularis TaxID=6945 RepID=B7PLQ2_IXOSC|nr:hypothetical protein IscW_ISCW005853 [Ixodes scapularis]|eukprot:XP_002434700.1 hypothetical protein IscW_ISCW005853 [Ixodes scapularis]